MAREKCRYVSTSFWDDEWIQSLDPSEKLLYLYLLTNPLTTIAGIYKITIRRMCFDTGFNADTVGHILGKFEKAEKVFMFDGWLILPNWPKHQKVGKDDNNRKGIDALLKMLPNEVFQFIIQHGYTYQYINDLGREIEAPYKPLTSPSDYINLNLNRNLNSNPNRNSNTPPQGNHDDIMTDHDSIMQASKQARIASNQEEQAITGNAPFEKVLIAWYQKFLESTCLTIQPSEEDRKAAAEAMKQLGNDEAVGLRAVGYYWNHWQDLWFAYKSSDKQKPPAQRRPDYSFRGFARNITSCLVTEKVVEAINDPF